MPGIFQGRKIKRFERMVNGNDGKLELLTNMNSALVLVDYQPAMLAGVASGDKAELQNAAYFVAKAASILGIPVILSAIQPEKNGDFDEEITRLFPGQEVFYRVMPEFDAFEDEKTWNAFKKTGRKKMIISGLWTSMCVTWTALHGIREGCEVYGLMDATGDSNREVYKFGIKRMLQAGVVPITVKSLVMEWMHDWDNPKSMELVKEVYSRLDAITKTRIQ